MRRKEPLLKEKGRHDAIIAKTITSCVIVVTVSIIWITGDSVEMILISVLIALLIAPHHVIAAQQQLLMRRP
jgi:hypothetical protein